jgi:hypothetical protein
MLVNLEVLALVIMEITFFRNVTPCDLTDL